MFEEQKVSSGGQFDPARTFCDSKSRLELEHIT